MTQKVLRNPAEGHHRFRPFGDFKKGEDSLALQWESAGDSSVQAISPRYGAVTFYTKPGGIYIAMDIRGLARYINGWEQFIGWVRPGLLIERALEHPSRWTHQALSDFEFALVQLSQVSTPTWVQVPKPNRWRPKAIPHVG